MNWYFMNQFRVIRDERMVCGDLLGPCVNPPFLLQHCQTSNESKMDYFFFIISRCTKL